MTHMTLFSKTRARLVRVAAFVLAVGGVAACSDFLVAENSGAVEEPDVNNTAYITRIANQAIFGFQEGQDDAPYWNAQLSDELYNRAVFVEEGQIDRRDLSSDMTYINAFLYAPMQRARFLGEDAAKR